MSKAIETLKKVPVKNDVLYEHIADTYFYQRSRQRSFKRKLKAATANLRVRFLRIAAATGAAFLLAWSILFLRSQDPQVIRKNVSVRPILQLVNGPSFNRSFVKRLQFRGDAKTGSRFLRDSILLDNAKKYRWADLSFDFKCPVDLSGRSLSMTMRGKTGGERVCVVLRDSNNRSARISDIYLSSSWKVTDISLEKTASDIDLRNISHFRIESGYTGESAKELDSSIDVSAYIKDIRISKEKRL
jgi:hypothetical protein